MWVDHIQTLLLEKEILSKKRFVCAGATKIYLTQSVRTKFLRGSRVYFAKWCRVPTALNNFHFDFIQNSMKKMWVQNMYTCNFTIIHILSNQLPLLVNNMSRLWKFTHLTFQLVSCINYCHEPWNLAFCKWISGGAFSYFSLKAILSHHMLFLLHKFYFKTFNNLLN